MSLSQAFIHKNIKIYLLVVAVSMSMSIMSRVGGVADSFNNSIETIVLVSGIFNYALGAIRFDKRVGALHDISVTVFLLGFDVLGVCVMNTIVELVAGMSLYKEKDFQKGT